MKKKLNAILGWTFGSFNVLAVLILLFFQPHDLKDIDTGGGAMVCCGGGIVFFIFFLIVVVFPYICLWKIFAKAGKPGWAALIPIYNLVVLTEIVGRPTIWVLYCIIPIINIYFGIMLLIDLVKSFGKEPIWVLGLMLLPFIFYPMLAFGSAEYKGPSVAPTAPTV